VRSGTKICPGCHHQFAMPVSAKGNEVRARRRSYVLPTAGGLALAGLAFFYVSGGKDLFLEPESVVATAQTVKATEIPRSENAAALFIAPSSSSEVAPPLPEETSAPEQDEPAPAAAKQTPARSVPALLEREGSAPPPLPKTDGALDAKREDPKVAAKAVKPEIKTEPKAVVKLVPPEPVVETSPENLTPVPSLETVVEVKATQEAKASVPAAERPKVSAANRGVPVVERSRVAAPGQVNAIARQAIRGRDCAGKWEGDCRQFPDHKPNW
jgi:hypothetical protein